MTTNTTINNKFKRIILFSSLNGGTGKSYTISQVSKIISQHSKVGLLDIDINTIGLTQLLKLQNERLESTTDSHGHTSVLPFDFEGIKFISAGLLDIGSDLTGLRSGALSGISRLLINEVQWGELDFLLIDLPTGLSDIELTILDYFSNAEILLISNGNIFSDKRKLQYYINRGVQILGLLYNQTDLNKNLEKDCIIFCQKNNIKYFGRYIEGNF